MSSYQNLAQLVQKRLSHSIFKTERGTGIDVPFIHQFMERFFDTLYPERKMVKIHDQNEYLKAFHTLETDFLKILEMVLIDSVSLVEQLDNWKQEFSKISKEVYELIELDRESFIKNDPAIHDTNEIILCYPGFKAILYYRFAHILFTKKLPLIPRVISEYAHSLTGIDIHPGAIIGKYFFIDHGTGVVIGETTIVGDHVKIYQGVTLGALSVSLDLKNKKRHPSIGNHVVIYANATILGGNTEVGDHSIVGGSVWLTKSIPRNSVVYHKSEIKTDVKNCDNFEFNEEALAYEI